MKNKILAALFLIGFTAFSQTYTSNPFLYDWTRGFKSSGDVLLPSLADGTDTIFLVLNAATGVVDSISIAQVRAIVVGGATSFNLQQVTAAGAATTNDIYVSDSLRIGKTANQSMYMVGKQGTNNPNIDNLFTNDESRNMIYTVNGFDSAMPSSIFRENTAFGVQLFGNMRTYTVDSLNAIEYYFNILPQNRSNSIFGHAALVSLEMGGSNSAFGRVALSDLKYGAANTAFGMFSLGTMVEGSANSGFGLGAFSDANGVNGVIKGLGGLALTSVGSFSTTTPFISNYSVYIGSELNPITTLAYAVKDAQNDNYDSISNVIMLADGEGNLAYTKARKTHRLYNTNLVGWELDSINNVHYTANFFDANGAELTAEQILVSDGTSMNATNRNVHQGGTTAQRPSSPAAGQVYFDTTLDPKQLILYNGTAWVNTDGTAL
jgi:hypothetical protein